MNGHGGARRGAGRPIKWGIDCVLSVGQACEESWCQSLALHTKSALERRSIIESELQYFWSEANRIPVRLRRQWIESYKGQIHRDDFKKELLMLSDMPSTGVEEGVELGVHRVVAKPPKGTRKRIVAEVAKQFDLPEKTVDNLWQAYRRFEKEVRATPYPAGT